MVQISGLTNQAPVATGEIGHDNATQQTRKATFAQVATFVSANITAGAIDTTELADDAVTLGKMASGTTGNLITYDVSGNPAAVPTGTATHVLTSNGAGAVPTFQAIPSVTTFYNGDDTLAGNRTIDGGGFSLDIFGTDFIALGADGTNRAITLSVDNPLGGTFVQMNSSQIDMFWEDASGDDTRVILKDGVIATRPQLHLVTGAVDGGSAIAGHPLVLDGSGTGECDFQQLDTTGIADDAITLAKMASGTTGNLITYDVSGNPAAVPTGTSGQVLTSNGAGAVPTFQAAGGAGNTIYNANDSLSANRLVTMGAFTLDFDGTADFTVTVEDSAVTLVSNSSVIGSSQLVIDVDTEARMDWSDSSGSATVGVILKDGTTASSAQVHVQTADVFNASATAGHALILDVAADGEVEFGQLDTVGIADDAITLAKMASGTAGNLITYDASGNPAAVLTGTSGHVLTSNGAGAPPTFQAGAASQNLWETISSDSGSTVASTPTDTLTIAGGTGLDTAIAADTVTVNITALGVDTAQLADDAVTLAKMAAGTAGNLITYDASGNPAAVATGTANQVLTSNGAGAAPTFQAASMTGPGTSTDNAIARYDGTGGDTLQDSGILIGDSDELSGFVGDFNDQTGTTYTLLSSDTGKVITLTNAAAITLTCPDSLAVGFNCTVIQGGAGTVTFSAGGGATINNRQSHTTTAGQYAATGLIVTANSGGSAAVYNLSGDTAT